MAIKKGNNGLLLKLLGVAIAYQVLHQVFMWYTLRHEFDAFNQEDECAISSAGKPLCLEAQLFRSWQRAAEVDSEDANQLLEFRAAADSTPEPSTPSSEEDELSQTVVAAKAVAAKAAQDARKELEELFDGVLLALNNSSSVESMTGDLKGLQSTLQARLETLPDTHKKLAEDTVADLSNHVEVSNAIPNHVSFDDLYAEVSKTLSNRSVVTPWAQGLSDVQEQLEAASHHQKEQEHKPEQTNPWAQSLVDLQRSLEARKQELGRLHEVHRAARSDRHHHPHEATNWTDFDKTYEELMNSMKSTTISPFAQGLLDSQAKMQKQTDDLAKKHQEHAREREAEMMKLSGHASPSSAVPKLRGVDSMKQFVAQSREEARTSHEAWERNFSDSVRSVGKDLCSDVAHRDSPACAAFTVPEAKTVGNDEKLPQMTHDQWMANVSDLAESYRRDPCLDPQWKGTAPCLVHEAEAVEQAQFGSNDTDADKSVNVKAGLRGAANTAPSLAWRLVKTWKATPDPHVNERKLATLTRAEVRHLHWGGMIPKVGLVSVIPSGREAKFQMRYFIDNFLLNSYEGAKQLILVYHHADREAQRWVKEHADGSYIKGVASRGDGTFPSTSDFRFGAYSSDADIIARWDFNTFHMPHLLSAQVRAMALSGRPASVLGQEGEEFSHEEGQEVLSQEGHKTGCSGHFSCWRGLVGEASWMRENWLPLSDSDHLDVLQNTRMHQVVTIGEDHPAK